MPAPAVNWAALPDALTIPEAAAILGISTGTAHRGADQGDIPVVRVCNRKIVPKWQLMEKLGVPKELAFATPEPTR